MHDKSIPLGFCQCGCGRRTNLARKSETARGYVKGQPVRYISGHATRSSPRQWEERDCGYTTPCHVWQLAKVQGYGRVYREGKGALAHIVEWEKANGPVPDGLELDHLCRVPACVNPAHLEPVTHTENVRRGGAAKLTIADVRMIRASSESALQLAGRLGVCRATIYAIRSGDKWAASF